MVVIGIMIIIRLKIKAFFWHKGLWVVSGDRIGLVCNNKNLGCWPISGFLGKNWIDFQGGGHFVG